MNSVTVQVRQEDVKTETKTRDNVIVVVNTSVQFAVDPDKVQDYYFKLSNPWQQMAAHVENIVRGHIPKMELDAVYSAKQELADEIKTDLSESMSAYGVHIHSCLMTDISPDRTVLNAMNEINAAKRNREANIQRAEADKLTAIKIAEGKAESQLLEADADAKAAVRKAEGDATAAIRIAEGNAQAAVKMAEADAEVQRLNGVAIAKMKEASGLDSQQVVHMMIATQYLDALKQFGKSGKSAIVVPHGPSAVQDIESQVVIRLSRFRSCTHPSTDSPLILLPIRRSNFSHSMLHLTLSRRFAKRRSATASSRRRRSTFRAKHSCADSERPTQIRAPLEGPPICCCSPPF